jgi:hypothetical protein
MQQNMVLIFHDLFNSKPIVRINGHCIHNSSKFTVEFVFRSPGLLATPAFTWLSWFDGYGPICSGVGRWLRQ